VRMMKRILELLDESDRGAVIVAAALLEDDIDEVLKKVIKGYNVSEKHIKAMFDLNGPLSSFSSKILVCYGFGLISKEIYDDLTKIRKLRNKFAHSTEKIDFLSVDIEDHVATINCCIEASKQFVGSMFKGRKNPVSEDQPKIKDWEIRSKGYVKYTKSVFCLGVKLLHHKIMRFHLEDIKT
jgi:DNA-binding MltR family transcriptional regulator